MPGLQVHFEVLNQLNSPALYADTLANRPAAQLVGRIFFRTDSPFGIYRDTGSAWDLIASPDTTGISGSGLAGQVPYFTGASTIGGTNNLFWDSTNNRLGINTATPGVSLDIHGAGSIVHINGTGTSNAFQAFQNAGTTKWRIGNNYSAATNYFSIYDFANSVESFKLESGATNILTINASTTNQGNIKIQKAGANPRLEIQQDTPSATNKSEAVFLAPVGFGAISKYTSSTTALKIIAAEDFGIYNYASSGDIAVLNDFATGKIKFATGGSSTAQATLTAAGRLLLGTTTESTYILDVVGTARVSGASTFLDRMYVGTLPATNALITVGGDSNNPSSIMGSGNYQTRPFIAIGNSPFDGTTTNFFKNYLSSGSGGAYIGINGNSSSTGVDPFVYQQNGVTKILFGVSISKRFIISDAVAGISTINFSNSGANDTRISQTITSTSNNNNGTADLILSGNSNTAYTNNGLGASGTIRFESTRASPTAYKYRIGLWNIDGFLTLDISDNGAGTAISNILNFTSNGNILINSRTETASAKLKIDSTTQGFLLPRMTTTQKNAISSPAQGLMVFDTTLIKLCVYSGTAWETITSV